MNIQSPTLAQERSLSWSAPLRIGTVALRVHDLPKVTEFYRDTVGLKQIEGDAKTSRLGAGTSVFLELRGDPAARKSSQREAGLFHTAFLLPARADLGRWITHAVENRFRLQGSADHLVSEALYLADPEGNGIEIYTDKPAAQWRKDGDTIAMSNEPLDFEGIVASAGGSKWAGAPDGSFVGHIHLQVGDIPAAEKFYSGLLGYDITNHYPSATFYSTGGYHHHLATNTWNSRGAARREAGSTGLDGFEIVATSDAALETLNRRIAEGGLAAGTLADPWGTRIHVTRA